ncbi:MAG TPA: RNA polymerase sigma factor [Solimonas sp.]
MGAANDAQVRDLDAFLASVERRALRAAAFAVGSRDDALDVVQDAMLELAKRYAARPPAEWPPLFQRILDNGILQFHRRRRRQTRWFGWRESDDTILDALPDAAPGPERQAQQADAMTRLEQAMRRLPLRQQQVVRLRVWEGLDVADTARTMGCGEGSVKTHLSRALASLRDHLEGYV